jgi:hypothetical protein
LPERVIAALHRASFFQVRTLIPPTAFRKVTRPIQAVGS